VVRELENPAIWDTPERAQELGRERSKLENVVNTLTNLDQALIDATDLIEMAADEDDEETLQSVVDDLETQEQLLARLEFERMFSGEMDANNAYLEIQSGSGGTEAQDWAEMILRMYLR